MTSSITIEHPSDFEKVVALSFKMQGYEITMPPIGTKGYDIELRKGDECIAVQVKNHKAKCNTAQIKKFQDFLALPCASKFTEGWFICANGYSNPALTEVRAEKPPNFRLGTFITDQNKVSWDTEPKPPEKIKYIGIFTCKGGVGKTTVAAHLAGAFALMGYDVILLDLDPERNLRKLFANDPEDPDEDASIFIPSISKNRPGTTITVLDSEGWDPKENPDIKIVICDCSPVLKENPRSLVEIFDYCIIPTTLNPLGVSKNSDVIIRTFEHIRQLNSEAEMFALVNNYQSSTTFDKKNDVLKRLLRQSLSKYTAKDSKCKFIDPDLVKIRHSIPLFYWGYHIVEGTKPQLAFNTIGGKCHPRTDFLQLAEYLEEHTTIDELKEYGY